MKNSLKILTTIIILTINNSYCQVLDTIITGVYTLPDTINKKNKKGLKEGYWLNYKKELKYSYHTDFGKNYNYKEYNYYTLLSEGNYKNGEKTGLWKYYNILNHKVIGLDKTTIYYKNGKTLTSNKYYKYELEINKDTTDIKGKYFYTNDTIIINCKKNKCFFKINNNIIDTFDKSNFEIKFYGLLKGEYNRKIKTINNE